MSVRKYVAMVNGEAVDLTAHLRPTAERVCDCGASCPPSRCFENLRRRPYESYEGHCGDE
jgi:hypothetical protein